MLERGELSCNLYVNLNNQNMYILFFFYNKILISVNSFKSDNTILTSDFIRKRYFEFLWRTTVNYTNNFEIYDEQYKIIRK